MFHLTQTDPHHCSIGWCDIPTIGRGRDGACVADAVMAEELLLSGRFLLSYLVDSLTDHTVYVFVLIACVHTDDDAGNYDAEEKKNSGDEVLFEIYRA